MNAYIEFKGLITPKLENVLCGQLKQLMSKGITEVDIGINSTGGDTDSGKMLYYNIMNLNGSYSMNINTINLSKCYSSAVLMYLAGNKRTAMNGSSFLIHDGSVSLNGSYKVSHLKHELKVLEEVNKSYIEIVKRYIDIQEEDYYKETIIKYDYDCKAFINEVTGELNSTYDTKIYIYVDNKGDVFVD